MQDDILKKEIQDHIDLANQIMLDLPFAIKKVADLIYDAFEIKNKLILFGNGGSAADAQHIAAEFTGRFLRERKGLPAIALTTDTSALTAIGNDYGFEFIFSRQVEAIANDGDVLIGISTSGNSVNVIKAIEKGKELNCVTISFTGKDGGLLSKKSDLNINIEHNVTARIQEMHILVGHLLCKLVDDKYKL
jgi:D-sedoheptulose 7-phosphate isomerase